MTIRTVRNLRRISQVVFFLVFFWLILQTTFEANPSVANTTEITLPYPVSIALEFDPLTALMTILSSATLYHGLLWSLIILIPTFFLGRFFCGWICPLGSLNHWLSEMGSERAVRKGSGRIESNRYHNYQRIKYYVFVFLIGTALTGSLQAGLLDPLPLLARSLGTVVLPTAHTGALSLMEYIRGYGIAPLTAASELLFDIVSWLFFPFRQAHFHGITLLAIFFAVVLILNRVFTRFWCRAICPLGALLGVASRFAVFGLKKDPSTCDHCNLCLLHCQGADNPDVGRQWRQAECHLCLNCQASCPQGSLTFQFFPHQEDTPVNPAATPAIDITRRKAVLSLGAGVVSFAVFRSGGAFTANSDPRLIRPPFARSEDVFLAKCIRCGQCMRVCPNNALHPTMLEAGLEGIWTPMLIPKVGYCEPTCTLCGQVCPTGAIPEFNKKEKIGDSDVPPNRIGTAFIDQGRCLPWSMATPCIVCEEWCPTSPKAVYLEETVVTDRKGQNITVKRPYVDPSLCTGCGACEFACPVADRAAITITAVGESRSADNQILLERRKRAKAESLSS